MKKIVFVSIMLFLYACSSATGFKRVFKPGFELDSQASEVKKPNCKTSIFSTVLKPGEIFSNNLHSMFSKKEAMRRLYNLEDKIKGSQCFKKVMIYDKDETKDSKDQISIEWDFVEKQKTNIPHVKFPLLFLTLLGAVIVPNVMELKSTMKAKVKNLSGTEKVYQSTSSGVAYYYISLSELYHMLDAVDERNVFSILEQIQKDKEFIKL